MSILVAKVNVNPIEFSINIVEKISAIDLFY
ncbi:MAG: hypothetical protein ACJAS9_003272 [Polaribacter sp.]|jgi:hypothetical protein